jgi:hypothetical protein
MVTRVVYNNKAFKILNRYGFKFSNNEVTFNDITIDFTGCTLADVPYKYQEIQIRQAENEEDINNGTVLFTGYLDDIKLSEMKMQNEFREITLTLLSPLKLATKRSVSLIGTYDLDVAIKRIIQPLIDDGFILKELNIVNGKITTNFVLETVENCMNSIGYKRNIFWFINEKKEIFINSIDYLFGLNNAKTIIQNIKEKGLLRIQPNIQNSDYANIINFKNVRIFDKSISSQYENLQEQIIGHPILKLRRTVKKGDVINFIYPIVVDEDTMRMLGEERKQNTELTNLYDLYALRLSVKTGDKIEEFCIYLKSENSKYTDYIISDNISFSSDAGEEKTIVLQRDTFFSNLITGFKWNGDDNTVVEYVETDSQLRYTTMRFMYSAEIEKSKGIISMSGQIEKTIDYKEKWTTTLQLIEYARSLMIQNSNSINQVILEYDINPNLKIGDIVEINAPSFLILGRFAVKEIDYSYYTDIKKLWRITLRSTDLISTYIDMFRPTETTENQDNIDTVILSEYIEEYISEVHTIEEVENEN